MNVVADQAFLGNPVGLLGRLRQALLPEKLGSLGHIAFGLLERLPTIQHARIRLRAQILHHCGSDFHNKTPV
jgi:hypothetical protein